MRSQFSQRKKKYLICLMLFCFAISCFAGTTAQAKVSDTAKGGIGGGLIGALAGSFAGYAGAGALIGGGVGLAVGAISDSSKDKTEKVNQDAAVKEAYQKGVSDGSSVHYAEGPDRKHVDSFGNDLKN